MTTTFQASTQQYTAPGVEGGWASANPNYSLLQPGNGDLGSATPASQIAWLVGATGAVVGRFAFADTANGDVTNAAPGTGVTETATAAGPIRVGFVQRDQMALITTYLAGDTLTMFQGQPITLISSGDVWCKFAGGATVGYFVFAKYADGTAVAVSSTTAPTSTLTADVTSGSANLANLSASAYAGEPISGTGIAAGAYLVSVDNVAHTAVMSANGTATNSGVTVTRTTAVLTPWRVASAAGNNEIAKISVRG